MNYVSTLSHMIIEARRRIMFPVNLQRQSLSLPPASEAEDEDETLSSETSSAESSTDWSELTKVRMMKISSSSGLRRVVTGSDGLKGAVLKVVDKVTVEVVKVSLLVIITAWFILAADTEHSVPSYHRP